MDIHSLLLSTNEFMKKSLLNLAQIRVYVLFVVYGILTCTSYAQEERIVPRSQGSSFEGHHFYIGFMRNELEGNRTEAPYLKVFIATSVQSKVSITFPRFLNTDTYTIIGDTVLTIDITGFDQITAEATESEVPRYNLIEITSDQKINVSAISSYYLSTDGYSALPVPNWGKEYVIMSMGNDQYIPRFSANGNIVTDTTPRSGEFLVMASQDSTLVQFRPRVRTMRHDSDEFVSVYLMKGQSYLVQSSDSLLKGYGDLTGTIVRSDKPIGVLSGHMRTSVPLLSLGPNSPIDDSKDFLIEMLFPTKIWGKNYATFPFSIQADGDLVRVTCIEPNTVFTINSRTYKSSFILRNPGDWEEFYPVGQSTSWTSDKPISIVQYMPTSLYRNQFFDPAMVVIPPIEQYISRSVFTILPFPIERYDRFGYNFINIVCEPSAVSSLKLDGTLVVANNPDLAIQKIFGMNLNFISIPLQPGVHRLSADTGKFSGIIYGVGQEDSYAYPLGLSLYKSSIQDSIPPVFNYSDDCGSIKIFAKERLTDSTVGLEDIKVITDSTTNFQWTIKSTTDSSVSAEINAKPIDYNHDGVILVETRDKLGNGRRLKYTFNALTIDVRSNIIFKSVSWLDSICERVVVKNYGTDTIFFNGGKLSGDKRVNFYEGEPQPKQLAPNDSIVFTVCFKPLGDSTELKAMLSLSLPCDRIYNIPVLGKVAALSIDTLGWDFGKVLVGDTVCSVGLIINDGNKPIDIFSLKIEPFEPSMVIDTAGLLPVTLEPGDTLKIPVCFIPTELRKIVRTGIAVNSFNLTDNTVTFQGEGVAPQVESVKFDWQKVRTSTEHDSIVMFVNHGSYDAYVNYVSASGDTSYLNSGAEIVLPYNLRPFIDTLRIATKFIPPSVTTYHSAYTFEVTNWKPHKPVTLTLDGQGTQPTIKTFNVDFDTIAYRRTKDTTAIVITSGGNEDLTIDTMILASGDISSFIIENQYLGSKKLPVNTNFTLPIRFAPSHLGLNTAEILVINDALPAYKRDTARIILRGFAISIDTFTYSFDMLLPTSLYACTSDTITIDLKNTGNRPLNFQSIVYNSTNVNVTPVLIPQAGIIERDSSLKAIYAIEMKKELVGSLSFTTTCNDTIVTTKSEIISSVSNPLTLKANSDTTVAPGVAITVPFSGTVDAQKSMPILLHLSAALNFQTMILQSQTGIITFTDKLQTRTVPAHFRQERTRMVVTADKEIDIATLTNWKVSIPFTVMLSDSSNITIPVIVEDTLNPCFTSGATEQVIHFSPVCANLLRRVTSSDPAFKLISITPSPVGEFGEARCIIQGKGIVTLEAVNQLGERILLASTQLSVGEYSIRFSTENLSNGVYGIILRAADGREERSVIVIDR